MPRLENVVRGTSTGPLPSIRRSAEIGKRLAETATMEMEGNSLLQSVDEGDGFSLDLYGPTSQNASPGTKLGGNSLIDSEGCNVSISSDLSSLPKSTAAKHASAATPKRAALQVTSGRRQKQELAQRQKENKKRKATEATAACEETVATDRCWLDVELPGPTKSERLRSGWEHTQSTLTEQKKRMGTRSERLIRSGFEHTQSTLAEQKKRMLIELVAQRQKMQEWKVKQREKKARRKAELEKRKVELLAQKEQMKKEQKEKEQKEKEQKEKEAREKEQQRLEELQQKNDEEGQVEDDGPEAKKNGMRNRLRRRSKKDTGPHTMWDAYDDLFTGTMDLMNPTEMFDEMAEEWGEYWKKDAVESS